MQNKINNTIQQLESINLDSDSIQDIQDVLNSVAELIDELLYDASDIELRNELGMNDD